MSSPATCPAADLLVRRLAELGVRDVFGYPGGQLTPVYDALHRLGRPRHYLARHEQAAAFMADGYARASGRPGVCLAVCGPGVLNAATPLATAFTDSIPLLLISGQIPRAGAGLRSGYYHENDQRAACATLTRRQLRVEEPEALVATLDEAWAALTSGRPGPVLLEVPLDVLRAEVDAGALPPPPAPVAPVRLNPEEIARLARWLSERQKPLLLAGGGVVSAGAEPALRRLAEHLGAPVFTTANGKCALPSSHPLAAGLPWRRATSDLTNMSEQFSPLFARSDGLLAVGCRFTQLATGSWSLKPPPLAHIDVDPDEIGRHYPVEVGLVGDARLALEALLDALAGPPRAPWTELPPQGEPWSLPGLDAVGPLRRALPPDGIVAADVTRLGYVLMKDLPLDFPRTFLHPAGYVSMGYALPAALGAKAAHPARKVVAVVGDGGLQMSALEFATVMQERLPVVVLLINDRCLTLIKSTQERRYAKRFIAVDLQNPDFGLLARSFGVRYEQVNEEAALEAALREALAADVPALVEVRVG
jgi:thiamine pyrophosphate-dependent acetolactate synthase large subunit-like protein